VKVLVFGFGSSPIFLKALVEKIQIENSNVEFSVVLSSSHHLKMMSDLLGDDRVLCLHQLLPKYKDKKIKLSDLSNYPDNIFKNIESEKITLKNRKSDDQNHIAYWTYKLIKDFMLQTSPNYILYLQHPEDMEGMFIGGLAKELNVPLAIPHHTRQLGLSFFSFHRQEKLPKADHISQEDIDKAKKFLEDFRKSFISPSAPREDNQEFNYIPYKQKTKVARLMSGVSRFFSESESRELGTLRVSLLNNWFPIWRNMYRGARKFNNKRLFNCESINDLPKNFIYYPIQYSPESSINIPAPYFIDQLRVIDAIRMAMPSDFLLVVKEHPVCMEVRPSKFVKSLLYKAGVIVVKYNIDSQELIKKSGLVISVTGTSAFEAFLYGKPSLVMGPTFFDGCLGGVCTIDSLPKRIKQAIHRKVKKESIIEFLSEVYAVSSDFLGRSPGEGTDKMMTYENVDLFWNAFIEHTRRESE
jgi:hypothetical protein